MDLGNPQSLNRYSYVGNNPLLFTDPTGLDGGLTITVLAICGHVSGACAGGFTNPISAIVLGSIFAGAAIADFVAGFFAHPTMTQSQTPRPPDKACSAPKYAQARNFISANRDYAQKLASQLNTDAENILGLSGNESGWGTGFLISAGTNNFFSLTSGKAFGGTIGTYQHGSYTYGTYPSPGFLTSGQSFADSYFGTRVNGISDPTNFAKALNANGSFNSESLATPYDKSIADTIKLTNKLMGCPAN